MTKIKKGLIGAVVLSSTIGLTACSDPTDPVAVVKTYNQALQASHITTSHTAAPAMSVRPPSNGIKTIVLHPVVSEDGVSPDDVDMLGVVDYTWYKVDTQNHLFQFGASVNGDKLTASTSDKLVYAFACYLWNAEQVNALTPAQMKQVMKDGHKVLGF